MGGVKITIVPHIMICKVVYKVTDHGDKIKLCIIITYFKTEKVSGL